MPPNYLSIALNINHNNITSISCYFFSANVVHWLYCVVASGVIVKDNKYPFLKEKQCRLKDFFNCKRKYLIKAMHKANRLKESQVGWSIWAISRVGVDDCTSSN